MSQLMQLQIENERTFLTYKYKKVQDMDDVILQLLNEADIEGFSFSKVINLTSGESLSSSCLSGGFVY